jgi:hypothetical protein
MHIWIGVVVFMLIILTTAGMDALHLKSNVFVTCYLLLVTCYLLLVTCYFLLKCSLCLVAERGARTSVGRQRTPQNDCPMATVVEDGVV